MLYEQNMAICAIFWPKFAGNARIDGQVLENRLDKTMIKYNEARW
jgi:hypothetical protein